MSLLNSVLTALQENPALLLRVLKETIRLSLHNESFRAELINEILPILQVKPIEPLYEMKIAARLCCLNDKAFLYHVREFEKKGLFTDRRYRLVGKQHRRHRLLNASEIEAIRNKVIRKAKGKRKVRASKEKRITHDSGNTFD